MVKKEVWNAVPTPNTQEKLIRRQEFPHWIRLQDHTSYFTLVLRCYTRDNFSFIHLCCSKRCT